MKALHVLLLPLLAVAGCMGIGKAGADLELGEPVLALALSLDAARYGVGAPILAELTLTNAGALPVTVGRLSPYTVEFFLRPAASPEPLATQMVSDPREQPEFVALEPGESDRRTFVLSRAALNEGEFDLFAVYRSEPDEAIELAATVASNSLPLKVALPVALERDSMGLIVQAEAERIASRHFGRPHSRVEARLILEKTLKVYLWWVTVYYQAPDEKGAEFGSCFVDPFLGRVRQVTDKAVVVEPDRRAVIVPADAGG